MQVEEVKSLLQAKFVDAEIEVEGDGSHFALRIISDAFEGLMPVKKQQLVYDAIDDKIKDGSLHAIDSMQLLTKAQWAAKSGQ